MALDAVVAQPEQLAPRHGKPTFNVYYKYPISITKDTTTMIIAFDTPSLLPCSILL